MIKFLFRIVFITLFVALILYYIQPLSIFYNDDFNRIKKKNAITFVTRIGPTTVYEIKNKKTGYHYSVMKAFADEIGVDLNIVIVDNMKSAINMIEQRDADIISGWGSSMGSKKLKYSYPYNRVDYIVVTKSMNLKRSNLSQYLQSNKVHTIQSDAIASIVNKSVGESKYSFEVWNDKNIDELLKMLNDNEIKLLLINSDEFKLLSKYYSNLKVVERLAINEPESWILPKDVDKNLEEEVSIFFKKMIQTNMLSNIYSQFFKQQKHSFVGTKIFLNDLLNVFPKYEFFFKEASKEYSFDWRLIASVGYQESRWKQDAVSYTGVKGIMMLTLDTAKDLKIENRVDPRSSIYGGTKYLRKIYKRIGSKILESEKKWFAIAAYNIGLGHLNDAIELARQDNIQVRKWIDVEPYILKLSQSRFYKQTKYGYARGWETVKYVQNIRQYYDILVFLDSQDDKFEQKDNEIPNSL